MNGQLNDCEFSASLNMSGEMLTLPDVRRRRDYAGAQPDIAKTSRYVADPPATFGRQRGRTLLTSHGSTVFVDISGFTKLSNGSHEGPRGAEQISMRSGQFRIDHKSPTTPVAACRFGDALLLWFAAEGSGCVPRDAGDAPDTARCRSHRSSRRAGHAADVAGRASGEFHFLRSDIAHRVAAHRTRVEPTCSWNKRQTGEILLSTETAALVPGRY
jgi:hypothetical protein